MYDEAAERTVVAGAFQWGAYDATTDQWEILFAKPEPAVGYPGPAAYDAVNRRLIVFGTDQTGIPVSGDVVAFDLVTREWTVLLEATPTPYLPAWGAP
jgi:hypothetical protein